MSRRIAINVEPDLSHFSSIVPCGVVDPRYGVTSRVDLGHPVTMADVYRALASVRGRVRPGEAPADAAFLAV